MLWLSSKMFENKQKVKAQFCNFALLLLHYSKFDGTILDSLEFQKFWTHNTKQIAKNKKDNIAVTYPQLTL